MNLRGLAVLFVCINTVIQGIEAVPNFEVDEQIKDVLLHLRKGETGIPGNEIPDPMEIPDFDSTVNQAITKITAKFSNVTIGGLSLFLLDHVESNLAAMNVHLGLNFSQLTVKGHYVLDGSVSWIGVKGNGEFWMNISEAYVSGLAQLALTESAQLQLDHVHLDISVQDIKLHFENLFGTGFFAKLSNTALNALSSVIFEAVKPTITEELSTIIKEIVNEQLLQIPALPLFNEAVSPLDDALEAATQSFADQGLEPMPLPSWERSFSRQILWVTITGQFKLENGHIKGLSTLYRTGNITVSFHNNTIILTADLGFDELQGGYTFFASLSGLDKKGAVHIRVTDIKLKIIVSQLNQEGSSPNIESLTVNEIEQISTDVDGLGTGDFALEWVSGIITNVFKYQLSHVIQGPIKQVIQDNLSDIKLPF